MEIWTILNKEQYNEYLETGKLFAKKEIVENFWIKEFDSPNFIQSYKWLSSIMKKKGILKHDYPMWAWTVKPDMRKERFNFQENDEIYIFHLEIPEKEILLSSFSLWHFVLSGMIINEDSDEIDISSIWDNEVDNKEKVIKSWNKILNIKEKSNYDTQACYNEINSNIVKGVRKYKVKN